MLKKIKITIKELAKTAVDIAEETLGSNKGKEKKKMAIEYITSKIPLPIIIKPLYIILLSSFIDDAIEFAVEWRNNERTNNE